MRTGVDLLGWWLGSSVVGVWIQQGVDEELTVIEKSLGGPEQEVSLNRPRVKNDQNAVATKHHESMAGVVAEPKGLHGTVTATREMVPGIMDGLQKFFRTEFFKGQKIQQQLPPPAKQNAIDGTAVFEALQG